MCTSKSLIHKVTTSASWCGVKTLDELTGGKDIGSSMIRLPCCCLGVDGVYPASDGGCVQQPLLLALRLILIVIRSAQYVVYGRPRFKREPCVGRYSFNRRGGLSSTDCLPEISLEVAGPD